MSEGPVRTSRPISALLLGLLATLVVAVGFLFGLGDRLEWLTLDVRFRNFPTAPPNHVVVHVDIDDLSLEKVGRWPWPRATQAAIIDTLLECGARAVALDIILPEPQEVRHVSDKMTVLDARTSLMLGSGSRIIFDDARLIAALRNPNVFMPMHLDFLSEKVSSIERKLETVLRDSPRLTYEEVLSASGVAPSREAKESYQRAKERAIDRRVAAILDSSDSLDFESVRRALLPGQSAQSDTPEREIVTRAYLRHRAMKVLPKFSVPASETVNYPARIGRVVPPMVLFAESLPAGRSGFVTFDPDDDGVVRRIPLLGRSGDQVYPQFALTIAAAQFARSRGGSYTIRADASNVTILCADGTERVIPVDTDGYLQINWTSPSEAYPQHIPASAVVTIWQLREKIRKNRSYLRLKYLELLRRVFPSPDDPAGPPAHRVAGLFARAQQIYDSRVALQLRRQRALLFDPLHLPRGVSELRIEEARIEARIDGELADLSVELRDPESLGLYLGKPEAPATRPDGDDQASRKYRRELAEYQRRASYVTKTLDHVDRVRGEVKLLLANVEREKAELRSRVVDKICFVGSTATGAADFVPTPVHKRTAGVFVHSSIFNTILSGAFVRRTPPIAGVLVVLLAGAMVSLLAATRPVLQAGPIMVLLALAYVAFNAVVVFGQWSIWMPMVAPLVAMLGGFLVVTAYRQLTEERAKRHIRGIFAHAMSPALVDRLIGDPSLARLGGEKRVVSCFFSDLQGFTTLSENLGEQRTVQLLNHYFDHMTEVIQDHCGGYVNKFLGDGLLVLFGAPVVQEDHAARSIHAAADCQQAVRELNAELAEEFDDPPQLAVRVGIATGEVMVGNCGSSSRMDYTAIGDTVNLASRLESANKQFGTHILVAHETWREARGAENYAARPLGDILVVGKHEPVSVWNVLGISEDIEEPVRKACADFARAVELYANRRFAAAVEMFEVVLQILPNDGPARIYAELCRGYISAPPDDSWRPALKLTEK